VWLAVHLTGLSYNARGETLSLGDARIGMFERLGSRFLETSRRSDSDTKRYPEFSAAKTQNVAARVAFGPPLLVSLG